VQQGGACACVRACVRARAACVFFGGACVCDVCAHATTLEGCTVGGRGEVVYGNHCADIRATPRRPTGGPLEAPSAARQARPAPAGGRRGAGEGALAWRA
jgi:hypothetical protein